MERTEWWLVGILFGLGLLTHFAWLTQPAQVIFDETHFGKFVTAYCCTHERFFDIHPPHAKLLIAGAARLGGYQGNFPFEHIGQAYSPDVPIFALRAVPALSGVLLPLLVFALVRQLGGSVWLAFLGGWLAVFDTALTLQTRVIALDGVLLTSTLGSISAWLAAQSSVSRKWWWWGLSGALAGLAAGTKFTGLAALALLGVLWLVSWWSVSARQRRWWVMTGAWVVAMALIVYLAGWAAHFWLLPLPGSGDAFHVPEFGDAPLPISFGRELIELHRVMLGANYNLEATHPYASHWWTWPFMLRPVFYWQGETALIYFLGNPLVWWGASLLILIAALDRGLTFWQSGRVRADRSRVQVWLPLLAFVIAFLPLIRVPRALFLYHYLMPLLFAVVASMVWLGSRGFMMTTTPPPRQWWMYATALGATLLLFIWFSPLVYGLPLEPLRPGWLFWFESWI